MTLADQAPASNQTQIEAHVPATLDVPPESSNPDYDLAPSRDPSLPRSTPIDLNDVDDEPLSPGCGRFLGDSICMSGQGSCSPPQSPFSFAMPSPSPSPSPIHTQLAFSAMHHLPVPVMVLNGMKTVALANEAMGRMLSANFEQASEGQLLAYLEALRGRTLAQIGIDMLQDDRKIWVTWDAYFDKLLSDIGTRSSTALQQQQEHQQQVSAIGDDVAPVVSDSSQTDGPYRLSERRPRNIAIDVIIARNDISKPGDHRNITEYTFATMTITKWETDDRQIFFTLTFHATHNQLYSSTQPSPNAEETDSSTLQGSRRGSTVDSEPESSFFSTQQRLNRMKDAVLDSMSMPSVAIWKDGSVILPNKSARAFMINNTDLNSAEDYMDPSRWVIYNEDFSRRLDADEWPIYDALKGRQPVENVRIGMFNEQGKKVIMEMVVETIKDETTNEYIAAVMYGRDVTKLREEISELKERDEERFKAICETMPQLVWTATPDGAADFFNDRWYSYTGLTPAQCIGKMWPIVIQCDDEQEVLARWCRSLESGDPFQMEYRCRNKDGEWRWFLGRALAVRDKETGRIEGWFGTCTDIHESMQANLNARRTRQQLLSVIAHSHVTIFSVDPERRITMLEGALIWNATDDNNDGSRWYVGEDMYAVFNRLTEQMPEGERPEWLQSIEDILEGRSSEDVKEHGLDNRWYRTRFIPMLNKGIKQNKLTNDTARIEGVIGVIMDVTELKSKEEALREQSREKRRAMASEAAAKEATRLKSQFLANMSHEVRTPIAGVLGMAELLGDTELNEEQREYVTNIQSSATSLLTVVNDILDFSKVESGQLDIEKVEFSLPLVVEEVGRILQFAIQRKNLDFQSEIHSDIAKNTVVIGDPGRLRQIIINLLTNSIKFTTQGHVKFFVFKEKETAETLEIKFVIEDTGIGIQEDIRRKLFTPFYQGDASTARRFGGTGLGLTICKNLLDLMNGRIMLDSTMGIGTTATFWVIFAKPDATAASVSAVSERIPDRLLSELSLPCNNSEYKHLASVSPVIDNTRLGLSSLKELPLSRRSKIHVLVVDDNPVNQKIAAKIIGKLGFQVSATWNGKEVLDYIIGVEQGLNKKPTVILMDVQMPIIDGYKCTHLLRHHLPYKNLVQNVPIVAVTASAIQGDREKCTQAGMDDYLAKPVTMKVLEKMLIKWCLSGRTAPPPEPIASDCSEGGEHCDNTHIPHVEIEAESVSCITVAGMLDDNSIIPQPLTLLGQLGASPVDSILGIDTDVEQKTRRPDEGGERRSILPQESNLIMNAAVGLPSDLGKNPLSSEMGPGEGEGEGEAPAKANNANLQNGSKLATE